MGQLSELHGRLLRLKLEARTALAEAAEERRSPPGALESKALADATEHLWRVMDALYGKANFNPDQPRVPAGNPGAGRWTSDPQWGGSGATPKPRRRSPAPILGDPKGPEPARHPPAIPRERPTSIQEQNTNAKKWGHWLAQMAVRGQSKKVRIALMIAEEASPWIFEKWPEIQTLFDEPRTLAELQRGVSSPGRGYQIHHIVERKPASDANYPEAMIESQSNKVRIPLYRHQQISDYYSSYDAELGMSPREFLKDKSWEERYEFGLRILIDYGVMLP